MSEAGEYSVERIEDKRICNGRVSSASFISIGSMLHMLLLADRVFFKMERLPAQRKFMGTR